MKLPSKKDDDESNWVTTLLGWVFILAGIGAVAYMLISAAPEKKMVCEGSYTSLTGFGSCRSE